MDILETLFSIGTTSDRASGHNDDSAKDSGTCEKRSARTREKFYLAHATTRPAGRLLYDDDDDLRSNIQHAFFSSKTMF